MINWEEVKIIMLVIVIGFVVSESLKEFLGINEIIRLLKELKKDE